ncbi:MAG: hypothetical protein DMG81_12120 [Acidobacteria bacterium]|nr:MAG: hypothetical protein DMG81_12120 [Acidobacteriota bacterium]
MDPVSRNLGIHRPWVGVWILVVVDVACGAAKRDVTTNRKTLLFQVWSYAHLPLYLCVAIVGVGVEHVISLPPGVHLHREDAWILTGAAAALMTTLTIIGFTSD